MTILSVAANTITSSLTAIKEEVQIFGENVSALLNAKIKPLRKDRISELTRIYSSKYTTSLKDEWFRVGAGVKHFVSSKYHFWAERKGDHVTVYPFEPAAEFTFDMWHFGIAVNRQAAADLMTVLKGEGKDFAPGSVSRTLLERDTTVVTLKVNQSASDFGLIERITFTGR